MFNSQVTLHDAYHGIFTEVDGVVSRLTSCCEASATFVDRGGEEALVCRACRKPVDDVYADAVSIATAQDLRRLERMMAPCASDDRLDCAANLLYELNRLRP